MYEYQSVIALAEGGAEKQMALAGENGWEIFAVTNGYYGAQISPPGFTLWMRRPKQSPLAIAEKPKATERLAEARRKRP